MPPDVPESRSSADGVVEPPPSEERPRDAAWVEGDDDDAPLVMERFRRSGLWIAVVLAPLLVVTLAQTALSLRVVLGVLAAGVVIVVLALLARR